MYGPCFSSIVGGHPLRSPTRLCLGRPLPYQLADGTQTPPEVNYSFTLALLNSQSLCGISAPFGTLSPASGQIIHVLLTRSPLSSLPKKSAPFDLHVLGTPPAFILSQDQTLHIILYTSCSSHVCFLFALFLRFGSQISRPGDFSVTQSWDPFTVSIQLSRFYTSFSMFCFIR